MSGTSPAPAEIRASIIARYGSEAAALLPCDRERAMREGTWSLVMPGSPETGPSLMGWRDGPASTMPPEVRRDVSTAMPRPASRSVAEAEAAYWAERAETREVLGAPPLPVWVRARRAILEEILEAPPPPLPVPPAIAAQAGETAAPPPDGTSAASESGDPAVDRAPSSPDPGIDAEVEPVQSGQQPRTREEARAAVRTLLGEPLTDREIARRVGVSPSTVAAVRKAST